MNCIKIFSRTLVWLILLVSLLVLPITHACANVPYRTGDVVTVTSQVTDGSVTYETHDSFWSIDNFVAQNHDPNMTDPQGWNVQRTGPVIMDGTINSSICWHSTFRITIGALPPGCAQTHQINWRESGTSLPGGYGSFFTRIIINCKGIVSINNVIITPQNPTELDNITFQATVTCCATYKLEYGDGTFDTAACQGPPYGGLAGFKLYHQYFAPGNYLAKLTLTDTDTNETIINQFVVKVNEGVHLAAQGVSPTMSAYSSLVQTDSCIPVKMTCSANASITDVHYTCTGGFSPPTGLPYIFNDPTYTFTYPGTYTVVATGVYHGNTLTSTPATIIINPVNHNLNVIAGGAAVFTPKQDIAWVSGGCNPMKYTWDFGDGSTQVTGPSDTGSTVSHTYMKPTPPGGSYTGSVTATDGYYTISKPLSITVNGLFTNLPTVATLCESVNGSADVPGGSGFTYTWTSDEGDTVNGPGYWHQFKTIGKHAVRVVATHALGTLSQNLAVQVTDCPGLILTVDPSGARLDPGGHKTVLVTVTPKGGILGNATLTTGTMPAGVSWTWDKNIVPCTAQGGGSVNASIDIDPNAPPIDTNISVTASILATTATSSIPVSYNANTNFKIVVTGKTHPVPIDDSGNIQSDEGLDFSRLNPIIHLSQNSFNLTSNTLETNLNGTAHLSGTVSSGVCNITPGGAGVISQIEVYIDDNPTPVTLIPITVNKGYNPGNLQSPYPYFGSFDASIPLAQLSADEHEIKLIVTDPVYKSVAFQTLDFAIWPIDSETDPQSWYSTDMHPEFGDSLDDTHPEVLRVDGTADDLQDPNYRVTVGGVSRKIISWPDLTTSGASYYVADDTGAMPFLTFTIGDASGAGGSTHDPDLASPMTAHATIPTNSQALFLQYFLYGFIDTTGFQIKDFLEATLQTTWDMVVHGGPGANALWKISDAAAHVDWPSVPVKLREVYEVGSTVYNLVSPDIAQSTQQANVLSFMAGGPKSGAATPAFLKTPSGQLLMQIMAFTMADANTWFAGLSDKGRAYQCGKFFAIAAPFLIGGAPAELQAERLLVEGSEGALLESILGKAKAKGMNVDAIFARSIEWALECRRTTGECFVAGTPVLTRTGSKPIERIQVGDQVLSRDPASSKQRYMPVTALFTTHPTVLYRIQIRYLMKSRNRTSRSRRVSGNRIAAVGDNSDGDGESDHFICTAGHPFWVVEKNKFVLAEKLRVGQHVLVADGTTALVVSTIKKQTLPGDAFTTYNFSVGQYHTYYVGKRGVWVHNLGQACDIALMLYDYLTGFLGNAPRLATERLVIMSDKSTLLAGKLRGLAISLVGPKASQEELAAYVKTGDTKKISTYKQWFKVFGGRFGRITANEVLSRLKIRVHHIVPLYVQRALRLPQCYDSYGTLMTTVALRNSGKGDNLVTVLLNEIFHTGPGSIHYYLVRSGLPEDDSVLGLTQQQIMDRLWQAYQQASRDPALANSNFNTVGHAGIKELVDVYGMPAPRGWTHKL